MAGANWLHSKGWLQINASRFSPGDFPALHNPLQDRESVFVAGDYDVLPRARVSGGWERFRANDKPNNPIGPVAKQPSASHSERIPSS